MVSGAPSVGEELPVRSSHGVQAARGNELAANFLEEIAVGVTVGRDRVTGLRLPSVGTAHALFGGGKQEELRLYLHLWGLLEPEIEPGQDLVAQVLGRLPELVPGPLKQEAQQAIQELLLEGQPTADSCVEAVVFRWLATPEVTLPAPMELAIPPHCPELTAATRGAGRWTGGHTKAVSCMAAACSGQLATGSNDGSLALWAAGQSQPTSLVRKAHRAGVRGLLALPGRQLASCGNDGRVRVWSDDLESLFCSEASAEPVMCLQLLRSSDGVGGLTLAAGTQSGAMQVIELGSGDRYKESSVQAHQKAVLCICECPDGGKQVCTGSADHAVCVWQREDWALLHTLKSHSDAVRCLAIIGDAVGTALLVSAAADGTVCMWDYKKGEELLNLHCGDAAINFMHHWPGGLLWFGSIDPELDNWDVKLADLMTGECRTAMAVDPQEGLVYSGWADGHIEAITVPVLKTAGQNRQPELEEQLTSQVLAQATASGDVPTLVVANHVRLLEAKLQTEQQLREDAEDEAARAKEKTAASAAAADCQQEQLACVQSEMEEQSQEIQRLTGELDARLSELASLKAQRQLEQQEMAKVLGEALQVSWESVAEAMGDREKLADLGLPSIDCGDSCQTAVGTMLATVVAWRLEPPADAPRMWGRDSVLKNSLEASASGRDSAKWQFRWSSTGKVHGPHSSEEMLEWHDQGYFEHASELQVRRCAPRPDGTFAKGNFVYWFNPSENN